MTIENPFFKVIADAIEEEAGKHGYSVITVSADRDPSKQAKQLDDFIAQGVVAIILNPCDSITVGEAIKAANEKGIPVFTNDVKCEAEGAEVVCHIATDNYQGGQLAGEAMIEALGEAGGEVVILDYNVVESCKQRVKGFREVIDKHNAENPEGKIDIVAQLPGGGLQEPGFRAAEDALQSHPNIAGLFAINDPSALGARAALEKANKADQVKIISFDGQPVGKQAIKEGKFYAEPIQFPDRMGRETVAMMIKHFAGEEVPAEIPIDTKLYRKADADNDPELQ